MHKDRHCLRSPRVDDRQRHRCRASSGRIHVEQYLYSSRRVSDHSLRAANAIFTDAILCVAIGLVAIVLLVGRVLLIAVVVLMGIVSAGVFVRTRRAIIVVAIVTVAFVVLSAATPSQRSENS